MNTNQQDVKPAYLYLADGTLMKGKAFGKIGTAGGELCFNTGMTGYQEVFTDPSYTGQMLIMNTTYVGNYGVNETDVESDEVRISGLICKNITERFSRFMATDTLANYLEKHGIVAIQDIDTRSLVLHVRDKGAMNCIISSELHTVEELKKALAEVPDMEGLELGKEITTKEAYTFGEEAAAIRIAVLDYGVKRHILLNLRERGAFIKVFPGQTTFEELSAFQPDGYFISNGPGDPAAMDYAVDTTKKIIESGVPLFGICLGHQLIARAMGIGTYKMHHGHRGLNHPVKNLISGMSEITTQNHGFGIIAEDVAASQSVEITHKNLNDDSIEGIRLVGKPVFSVQYHPESTPGPHDSRYLFDQFIESINAAKAEVVA